MNAKKFFAFAAAAALFVGFTACGDPGDEPQKDPIVIDPVGGDETPDESDLTVKAGFYTICFQPAAGTVCNDIYFVGNYFGDENKDWKLDAENIKMEPMEKFKGWYLAYIPVREDGTALQGKPIQAKADGSLAWDFQTGDENSWTVESGDVTIEAGYAGEANLTYNDPTKAVIYKSSSWKNGNSPCVEAVEHTYNVTVKLPALVEGIEPAIIGDFNGWAEGIALTAEADGSYKYSFTDEEGHGFKFKSGADNVWARQVQGYNAEEDKWSDLENIILGAEENISIDYSDAAKYRWTPAE